MSSLFKNLRIHQIFGANTDVGKTIFITALVRASALSGAPVHYLKPVSTGPMQNADDRSSTTISSPLVWHVTEIDALGTSRRLRPITETSMRIAYFDMMNLSVRI